MSLDGFSGPARDAHKTGGSTAPQAWGVVAVDPIASGLPLLAGCYLDLT